jgi:prolyl-tRNA synthetase
MLYNQWANVVRWELRPRLFLRTSEFLWQEGHTAHETEREAVAECLRILHEVYADTQRSVLAMPALLGRKSAAERFPGARETFTAEAMMGDRKALQAATSHYLGDEFARAYGVTYTGRDGSQHHPYATSWGSTTRLVGAVIMMHGDERGLRLPPAVAPHQVVVIPIQPGEGKVLEQAHALAAELRAAGIRVKLDDRDHVRPGAKFFEWELKGAPIRVELGERELSGGEVSVARRDREQRELLSLNRLGERLKGMLGEIHRELFDGAAAHLADNTRSFDDRAELIEYLRAGSGFAVTAWCGSPECEAAIKAETSATLRCLALEPEDPGSPCAVCGRPGVETATWGQAY